MTAEAAGTHLYQAAPFPDRNADEESYIPGLQGLALKNISFTVKSGKKVLYEEFGELLFTHQGISGPVVLTASSVIPDRYFEGDLTL